MPSSQSIEVTHTANFTTMVTGVGSHRFIYQWRHNGIVISGKTENTLMITNVMESDTGMYNCTVMNQYGDIASSVASLVVTGMYYAHKKCSYAVYKINVMYIHDKKGILG